MAHSPWLPNASFTLKLQSGEFTTTVKTSVDVGAIDNSARGISYDGTNTPWSGNEAMKLYLHSGQFTSTLKTSQGSIASFFADISWDRTNTPWVGLPMATYKLCLQSGQFTTILKASQDITAIDTVPDGISYDGTDTPWAGTTDKKFYLQSGQFTSTLKTSLGTGGFTPRGISYTGTDTMIAAWNDHKLKRFSGQFTTTIRSSCSASTAGGIETNNVDGRLPVVDPSLGVRAETIAYSYQAINTNAIIFLAPSLTADALTDADGGKVKEPIQAIATSHNGFLFSVNIAGVQRKLVRKFFIVNNSNQNIVSGKVWIQAQDQSPQLKIAHERNGVQQLILDGSTVAPIITGLPNNIPSYGVFSLHADEASGIQFGGDGNLPTGKRVGIWVLQTLEAGEFSNQDADFTIRCGINFES